MLFCRVAVQLLLLSSLCFMADCNNNNNNNTGHLLHAISPKSKEHIACYKHRTNYRYIVAKHCYSLQLQNIDKTLPKKTPTHPTAQLIKD